MSEFNGKKFYGFSLQNDPALSTTTRNFEFKYARPELLERAIQKVTDTTSDKQKKSDLLNKYCKVPKGPNAVAGAEKRSVVQTRDNDVETHMSRFDINKIRPLSQSEVDQIIGKAKTNCRAHSGKLREAPADGKHGDCNDEQPQSPGKSPKPTQDNKTEFDEGLDQWGYVQVEPYKEPQMQWVEIVETPVGMATLMEDVSEEGHEEGTHVIEVSTLPFDESSSGQEVNLAEAQEYADCEEDDEEHGIFSPLTVGMDNAGDAAGHYPEDSDLEFELIDREKYSKFCGPRPHDMPESSNGSGGFANFIEMEPDMSYLKNASPMRYTELTDDTQEDHDEAMDSQQMKVFIKSLSREAKPPVKSAISRATKDEEVARKPEKQPQKKPTPKPKPWGGDKSNPPSVQGTPRGRQAKSPAGRAEPPPRGALPVARSPRTPRSPRVAAPVAAVPPPASAAARQRSTLSSGSGGAAASSARKMRKAMKAGALKDTTSAQQHHQERALKNLIVSKSIEDLKIEKLALFTKMTTTQERTIELMDKLRLNLMEIYVPNSTYEKSKRQKNAFEFSVRFSRNFLYPLKGMIEDLKLMTVEQLNSASTNDATARVASIYALIYQSLQTYQKQLRYFLLDQVPQKLASLIEMVYVTTNVCLEKGVFDRHDAIIDCLQERCTKFLGFLEDMHDNSFATTRETYRKMTVEKSHSNYNLKMFMNDLNMYEPKLVPKNLPPKKRTLRKPIKKGTSASVCEGSSAMFVKKGNEDAVTTQMGQKFHKMTTESVLSSMQDLLSSSSECPSVTTANVSPANSQTTVQNEPDAAHADSPVNKAILDALQIVTKQQIREVLEPFMQSLGSALEEKGIVSNLFVDL